MTELCIFILTYNRPHYLKECLESIEAQSYNDFKVIVLDNASQFNCKQIINKFTNLNISYIRHSKNIGSTGNFMYAWSMNIDTPYTMIFHDDDIMHPELLKICLSTLKEYKNLAWVGTSFNTIKSKNFASKFENNKCEVFSQYYLANYLMRSGSLCFSSVVYKTSKLKAINLKQYISLYSIVFDRPLLLELSMDGGCAICNGQLVSYRVHPEQDSVTGPLKFKNILALITCYKKIILNEDSNSDINYYKKWASVSLAQSSINLTMRNQESIYKYLKKASLQLEIGLFEITIDTIKIIIKIPFRYIKRKLLVLLKENN
ncbi:glycosyltransferase family 2 protein [Polynucleobacter sp. MWH-UH24A]|uniref:glycosyltransferase family 2 protein n=1 Tax=Polynucleobacter sp. MWH-UH24A TaxID=2689110 RepID=UPI001BFE8216|nr:glycosyltransferase family 2 protein [Polynucleobacter sp. MWH-UH24A]QWD76423.1 glycosyltransferase family 2 protein [Polynucleobacter sp. MWH-UH24A]